VKQAAEAREVGGEPRRCYLCKRDLPLDHFPTITERKRKGERVYEYVKLAYDCRDCRIEQRRQQRIRKAEQEGRPYLTREELHAKQREEAKGRKAAQAAARRDRWRKMMAEQEERRRQRQESPESQCSKCRVTKDRSEFYASEIDVCKSCIADRDSSKFKHDRDTLSDVYIRRQLIKRAGIRARDIPIVLIEAKRAHLLVERQLHPHRRPDGSLAWLRALLGRGPVLAQDLNAKARAAGIAKHTLIRARRKLGAAYDPGAETWAINQPEDA
jgi:hypothetical protein